MNHSNKLIQKVFDNYNNLIKQTPPYYIIPLQKAIYDLREKFVEFSSFLNDPAELGSVMEFMTDKRNSYDTSSNELYKCILHTLYPATIVKLKNFPSQLLLDYVNELKTRYVAHLEQLIPDFVFRPEAGLFFCYNKTPYVFLSNFSSPHGGGTRLREVRFNREWFLKQKCTVIDLPSHLYFEGSAEVKYVKHKNSVDIIFGWGFRTSKNAALWVIEKIKEITRKESKKINIILVHLIDENFYHLDVALKEIPVIENGNVIDETIMYYPNAFDTQSQSVLKRAFPNALIVSEDDAQKFVCNSPTINKSIVVEEQASQACQKQLQTRGMEVFTINLSEFLKAGGCGKCLICEMDTDIFDFNPEFNNTFQMLDSTINLFDVVYVNDVYMNNHIGRINKGLAEQQYQNLKKILQKSGATISIVETRKNRPAFDFETLRRAIWETLKIYPQAQTLDDLLTQAIQCTASDAILKINQNPVWKHILDKYFSLFNSQSEYSWATLYQALHEVKKEEFKKGQLDFKIHELTIRNPEDFLEMLAHKKHSALSCKNQII